MTKATKKLGESVGKKVAAAGNKGAGMAHDGRQVWGGGESSIKNTRSPQAKKEISSVANGFALLIP